MADNLTLTVKNVMTATPTTTTNYMDCHTPPTNLALNQNGSGTGDGGGDNLLTIFSPPVVILALALVVVMTIAIIEGVIIAVSRQQRQV